MLARARYFWSERANIIYKSFLIVGPIEILCTLYSQSIIKVLWFASWHKRAYKNIIKYLLLVVQRVYSNIALYIMCVQLKINFGKNDSIKIILINFLQQMRKITPPPPPSKSFLWCIFSFQAYIMLISLPQRVLLFFFWSERVV